MTVGQGPTVSGFDQTSNGVDDLDRWSTLARDTLIGEQVAAGRIDLIFVDRDEMAELNLTHMGHEGPTDVLSFPLDAEEDDHPSRDLDFADLDFGDLASEGDDASGESGDPGLHLGDIVVCPAVAEAQAPAHCGTIEAEFSLLIIHGVLHILGHDHAEPKETAVMQGRERHHLARIGFEHPEPTT